ncbi:hypothetical protein M5K25_015131 [Dendrobium thyrsiflorum]|uniref:Uncharacterized protein n=1 Tax=Dendrobium thyrsiflorum TaxID=117978 RepID=A0ABD0UPR4_DENTH
MDRSKAANCRLSGCCEGTAVDRTRLRQTVCREEVERLYFTLTGKPSVQRKVTETLSEIQDRHVADKDLEKSRERKQSCLIRHIKVSTFMQLKNGLLSIKRSISVGYCSGHPIYSSSCVQTVQTTQKLSTWRTEHSFGKWQVESLQLPLAVNRVVPKTKLIN